MAIITISRGVQSGGRKLAHLLADKLGYQCLSREVVAMCAKRYNIPEEDLYERLMEAPSRWLGPSKEHFRYPLYIQCTLVDVAKQDNVIYHGYAGQLFLRGVTHALRVRLEAPLRDRVDAEMSEYGKPRDEAEKYIEKADSIRHRWVKLLYDQDWHDPALYDLSINLKTMSIESACDMMALLAQRPEFQKTDESVRRLDELSLACEVQAAIASDDTLWKHLWEQSIIVLASGSIVTLRGTVKNKEVGLAMQDVASKVKGVTECRFEARPLGDVLSHRPEYSTGHE